MKKNRWYDKHEGLANHLEALKTMPKRQLNELLRDLIAFARLLHPTLFEDHLFEFPLDPKRRRWYDDDPYLWLVVNGLRFTDDEVIHRVVAFFDKQINVKVSASNKKTVKKSAAKKAPAKKAPVKKAPVKKAPVKKAPVKKAPVKKAPVKKAPVKKAPVKKAPVKKAPAKKAPAKKAVAKKVAAKKTVIAKPKAKKVAARKVAALPKKAKAVVKTRSVGKTTAKAPKKTARPRKK